MADEINVGDIAADGPGAPGAADQDAHGAQGGDAEAALAAILDDLVGDVPEGMRDMIPDLPPVAKAKWLREARARGIFRAAAQDSGPDARRPGGRPAANMETMTPLQKISMGYGD